MSRGWLYASATVDYTIVHIRHDCVCCDVFQVVAKGLVERGGGGAIVHVSSIRSKAAGKDRLSYCVSKSALDQVMRVMALELGPYQVSIVILDFFCN